MKVFKSKNWEKIANITMTIVSLFLLLLFIIILSLIVLSGTSNIFHSHSDHNNPNHIRNQLTVLGIFITIALFSIRSLQLWLQYQTQYRQTERLHQERMKALEQGKPLPLS